jgi:hypothetical protein
MRPLLLVNTRTATYLLLALTQSLPLLRNCLETRRHGLARIFARRTARLVEPRVRGGVALGLAVIGDGPLRDGVDTLEARAGEVRLVDRFGRVALYPGLVGCVVGELILVCNGLETLLGVRC